MTAGNRFNSWIEYVNEKSVNFETDAFVIALTNSAPVATNSVLADITEISYANLSSRALTVAAASQTGGTYTVTANQLTLTASGAVATFRYVVMYDSTPAGSPLVQYWDYGSAVTMQSGDTFVIGATNPFTIWTDAPA